MLYTEIIKALKLDFNLGPLHKVGSQHWVTVQLFKAPIITVFWI